jgi:predicted transcriptional regulator
MDEYECEHAMAISIAKNELSESITMHMPLGLKKGRGRPVKATKGALNRQIEVKVKNTKTGVSTENEHVDVMIKKGNIFIDYYCEFPNQFL